MEDKTMEKLIKTIQIDIAAPSGLKDKMFKEITQSKKDDMIHLSPFERFIFKNPLGTACTISIVISGTLWAIMGNGYSNILSSFVGKR
ncbi:MAG: hypothetical protein K0R09_475 [Clostridiales bacterium]|jgi:hypothetical protein|nr:hypothetical protein [Clostridiales bacterium]